MGSISALPNFWSIKSAVCWPQCSDRGKPCPYTYPSPDMLTDDLLAHLFQNQPHVLVPPIATWLTQSRRFAAFVETFRDKIRKKLRDTRDAENLLDLRLELETAYLLLQERTLSVSYEPQPVGRTRCPDYAVTFTTSSTFMLEVTRLRPRLPTQMMSDAERIADTVCGKLGQLMAQRSNVLLIGTADVSLTADDLRLALIQIQHRAERNDIALFQRHGFRDRTDFFAHYQRLSELLVRVNAIPLVWINPQAKHPLSSKIRTALHRSQTLPTTP